MLSAKPPLKTVNTLQFCKFHALLELRGGASEGGLSEKNRRAQDLKK
jgi:hypothetical protein